MKKRLLSTLLALCMVLALLPAIAFAEDAPTSGTCGENMTWSYSDGVLTIEGTGAMDDFSEGYYTPIPPWNSYAEQIHTVNISAGVTSTGNGAFFTCHNLTSVTIPDSITSIGNNTFNGCTSLTSVAIPDNVTSIGDGAFRDCHSLTGVTIPDGVTYIGSSAFERCSSLTGVMTIPDGVTDIGYATFSGCSGLTGVTIPDGVTSIGTYAFSNCSSLTSVVIPDGVTHIGHTAFNGCSSLTSVVIPDGITAIDMWTFQGCSSLTSVTIPSSVTSIVPWAFSDCSSLTDVYYGGSQSQWSQIEIVEIANDPLLNAVVHCTDGDITPAPTFPDVDATAWYADAVVWAASKGITQGNGDGTFGPENPCTRAQTVTFLWRAYGEQEPTSANNPFTDVKPGDYYYKAVLWAVENGITSGATPNTFNPDGTCTRKEAVTFQYRAAGSPPVTGGNSFPDVKPADWYYNAVVWASANGVTQGNGDGTFGPDNPCTRGQIVTFLYRELA